MRIPKTAEEITERLFKEVDTDGNGLITREEFTGNKKAGMR